MPRTAAKKAARRLYKDRRPFFPLQKLPYEIQMLILCRCDAESMLRLLQISPHLQTLFRAYPEAIIREVLRQIPQPIANLLQLSWTLNQIDNLGFDPDEALLTLRNVSIYEWASLHPRILCPNDDPMAALKNLLSLHEEVCAIVDVYAQQVHACMEAFINPHVQLAPLILSTTEFVRMASSFWIYMIYYQLQQKFRFHGRGEDFVVPFVDSLQPWQLEQGLSVEWYLGMWPVARSSPAFPLLVFIEEAVRSLRRSHGSSYVERWRQLQLGGGGWTFSSSRRFGHALRYTTPGVFTPSLVHPSSYKVPKNCPKDSSLRNHGWIYFEQILERYSFATRFYQTFFLELGVFFWDQDRLTQWDLADPSDFPTVISNLDQRLQQAREYRNYGEFD